MHIKLHFKVFTYFTFTIFFCLPSLFNTATINKNKIYYDSSEKVEMIWRVVVAPVTKKEIFLNPNISSYMSWVIQYTYSLKVSVFSHYSTIHVSECVWLIFFFFVEHYTNSCWSIEFGLWVVGVIDFHVNNCCCKSLNLQKKKKRSKTSSHKICTSHS